jgi:hypothetical protein
MTSQNFSKLFVVLVAIGFLINVQASQIVRILMKDEGAYEQNLTKPRIIIKNVGTESISNFMYFFYFTVDTNRTPVIEPWYIPYSAVTLEKLSSQLYRIKYDFSGVTLLPGALLPDAGGNIIGMHYADFSMAWNKADDFSYINSAVFIEDPNIPVYVNGIKIYGNEPSIPPPPVPAAEPLAAYFYTLSQSTVFGNERVSVGDSVRIKDGSVGSNMYAEIGCASQIKGDVVSRGQIFLRERSAVSGDVIAGGLITRQNNTTITGQEVDSAAIDQGTPIIHNVTPGTANVTIEDGQSRIIEPGAYAIIHAYSRAQLTFKAGTYAIAKLLTEPDGRIIFQVKAGEEIKLNIAGEVRIADRMQMSYSEANYPAAVHIYSNYTGQISIGTDATMYGILIAPTATVVVASRTNVSGAIYARRVTIEPQAAVCKPPLLADLTHSEWAYAPPFDPLELQYKAFVPDATYTLIVTPTAQNPANSVRVNGGPPQNPIELDENPKDILVQIFGGECSTETNYRLRVERGASPVIYVNDDSPCATPECNGNSWESAFKDLQQALSLSQLYGKEIWVAEGTYKPTGLKNPPDRDATFQLTPGTEIIGGFKGTETNYEPDGSLYKTILSGDIAGNDGSLSAWPPATQDTTLLKDNVYHVVTMVGNKTSQSAKIKGFTIQGGVANGDGSKGVGGGLFDLLSSPHVELCVFRRNISKANGGGAYCGNAPVVIKNCLWEANAALAGNGGGLYVAGERKLLIDASVFDGNQAQRGGGVYVLSNEINCVNCIIVNNAAIIDGGGVFGANGLMYLLNCTVTANNAGLWTGGVCSRSQKEKTYIANSILWNNAGGDSTVGKNPYLRDIDGKQMRITYSCTSVPMTGEGNIAGDPAFVDEGSPEGSDGRYGSGDDGLRIIQCSPCRDNGDENAAPEYDLVLKSRQIGGKPDIGAYEFSVRALSTSPFGWIRDGNFVPIEHFNILDVFHHWKYIWIYSRSNYARVLRIEVEKDKYTKNKTEIYVLIRAADDLGNGIPDLAEVRINMKKVDEKNGYLYFQSTTDSWGKFILFVKDDFYHNFENPWAYVVAMRDYSRIEYRVPNEQF